MRRAAAALAIASVIVPCASAAAGPYGPPPAPAEPAPALDRETFVRRADAICGPVFHRVRPHLDEGVAHLQQQEFDEAADQIIPAYQALRKAYRKVAALKRPPDDVKRIRHWIDLELRQLRVGIDALHEYRAEDLRPAQRLTERSLRLGRKARRVVEGWGFRHCA